MVVSLATSSSRGGSSFQRVAEGFLAQPGLPFAEVLAAERIERSFAKHGGLFGLQGIYHTAVMVWSFLSQVLRDGKEASCQAAVARVVSFCQQTGQAPPTSDTGDYCRELWTTLLAYNLIRTTAAGAALLHDKQPRQISFTSTCQYVLASWMLRSCRLLDAASATRHVLELLRQIATCEVANRPGRLEPRVLKRRRHGYKLMQNPRHALRQELCKQCT